MSFNIATELVAHVASYLSGREASGPGGTSRVAYLASPVIDAILDSPCAQSLKSIDFGETGHPLDSHYRVAAGDLLRLVRGCPRLDYISGDVRFHKARNSDEATSPFDSGLLDAIYQVGDLLEERGGGMGLMIGRPADPPRF